MKIRNVFMSLLAIALIWACGKDEDPAPPKNNAPVIAAKTFSVPENIAAGTAIGTVTATDADKDAMTFSIKTNDNNLFAITKAGVLSLASGKSLDFATKAQHVITVAVSDGEASASAKVTINVTEVDLANNAPVIAAQQFTVSESIDDTFEIGAVQATDPEQDDLVFSIVTNDNDLFEITEAGSLTLAAGHSLDFGTAEVHTITVAVSDGNSSVNAEITIKLTQSDPNNLAPIAEPQEFSVNEDIDDVFEIGVVEAFDPEDDILTFSISMNDNDLFEISNKGVLSLAEGKKLDFALAQQHVITVEISDGNSFTKAEITIYIEEKNSSLADDPNSFVTTWKTETDGESITIGTNANYEYDYTIDWGDGTVEQLTTQNPSHEYVLAGTYIVAIQGNFPTIRMKTAESTPLKLMSIDQWGTIAWQYMGGAFQDCEFMVYNANDIPNLSNTTQSPAMFLNCKSFNANLSEWDVSNITFMAGMFSGASTFNQSLAEWNIGNVTNMIGMLDNSGISANNLNTTLISWSTPTQSYNPPINISIGIDGLTYCGQDAIDAADTLNQLYGWTFTGTFFEGPVCN